MVSRTPGTHQCRDQERRLQSGPELEASSMEVLMQEYLLSIGNVDGKKGYEFNAEAIKKERIRLKLREAKFG